MSRQVNPILELCSLPLMQRAVRLSDGCVFHVVAVHSKQTTEFLEVKILHSLLCKQGTQHVGLSRQSLDGYTPLTH